MSGGDRNPAYLFFDVETTAIRHGRLVQLAWVQSAQDGRVMGRSQCIVRPEGFQIPADATRIHGITTERALDEGIPLEEAIDGFAEAIRPATTEPGGSSERISKSQCLILAILLILSSCHPVSKRGR